jgi:hypothetical protein
MVSSGRREEFNHFFTGPNVSLARIFFKTVEKRREITLNTANSYRTRNMSGYMGVISSGGGLLDIYSFFSE